MKMIPLTNGQKAIVDDEDFDKVSAFNWFLVHERNGTKRARRTTPDYIDMARIVLEVPGGFIADHINGNPLDNRKANLRLASKQQNLRNRGKGLWLGRSSSRYKGVCFLRGKWQAQISKDQRAIYLGTFPCQFCAALAYDIAAVEHFGEFARPNFLKAPKGSSAA
ncbi:MAG TPA: HNH endonuclease [Syntrophales bacterium]|jgi:hypothetical protein|nr:HNH endonuclease [Syntrophales bacterium]